MRKSYAAILLNQTENHHHIRGRKRSNTFSFMVKLDKLFLKVTRLGD